MWARRGVAADIVIALAVVLFGLPSAFGPRVGPPHAELLLLTFGLALPLIWRRRAPAGVFGVLAFVAFLQWLIDGRLGADVALLVAFYTVAAKESRRLTIACAAVLEVGVFLATLRWGGAHAGPLLFVLLSGTVTAAGVIGTNMRTRRAYLSSLEDRAARLEIERDQQAQLAAAAERARIAREMHDIVAHNLSVMIALADGAAFTTGHDPARAGQAMEQVSSTGRQALREMRRLLGVLREGDQAAAGEAARQPQPGFGDLHGLLSQVRLTGLRGELRTDGAPGDQPPGLQLTIYRLVQEALTNTLKHATGATSVIVAIRFGERAIEVEVVDDGHPSPAASPLAAGHGITGMRERAAVYGGTVEAGPRAGGGWRVHASFDLASDTSDVSWIAS